MDDGGSNHLRPYLSRINNAGKIRPCTLSLAPFHLLVFAITLKYLSKLLFVQKSEKKLKGRMMCLIPEMVMHSCYRRQKSNPTSPINGYKSCQLPTKNRSTGASIFNTQHGEGFTVPLHQSELSTHNTLHFSFCLCKTKHFH